VLRLAADALVLAPVLPLVVAPVLGRLLAPVLAFSLPLIDLVDQSGSW